MDFLASFCDWFWCKKDEQTKHKIERRTNFITQETKEGREVFTISSQYAKGETVLHGLENVKIVDIILENEKFGSTRYYIAYLVEFQAPSRRKGEREWVDEMSLMKYIDWSVED